MAHCRAGELRMNGRANSGARNLLKTVSQTVGEKAHALVNPARAYPEVKVQSGIEACQERAIARAILHEAVHRSEEHTSELQSPYDLVCRLLLEKKKKN